MNEAWPERRKNLRKGPDFRIRLLKWLAVIAWGIFLALLLIVEKARPQFETLFDRYYGIDLRTTWDMTLAPYIGVACAVGLFISGAGLLASLGRYRRKGDGFPLSLIITALVFLLALAFHLIFPKG